MRCLRTILAVVTMLVVMATSATPTTARHDNDGWWDLELVVGLVRRLRAGG
jgi:hypothetical protein